MNMKGNLLSCWVGVVSSVVVSLNQTVLATSPPINGTIYFAGSYAVNGPLTNATAFTNFSSVSVSGGQAGPYTNAPFSTPVSYRPFTFNPPAAPVTPLWSFTNGGVIYSFDATSMTVVTQSASFLNILGTGIAHITGYADTPGTWTIAASTPSIFSSSAAVNLTNVPAFQTLWRTNGRITFNWNTLVGQAYQVQYKSNLTSAIWTNLGSAITATGSTAIASDVLASTNSSRFYRIVLLP